MPSFMYEDTQQVIIEIKKIMIEKRISQKDLAERLHISPQALVKLFKKKNFSFEDAKKILNAMEYDLSIDVFEKYY